MVTFDDVRRLGLRLPEVTESTWYGTPGLKVRNKGFCRLWGEREHRRDQVHDTEVLVVFSYRALISREDHDLSGRGQQFPVHTRPRGLGLSHWCAHQG